MSNEDLNPDPPNMRALAAADQQMALARSAVDELVSMARRQRAAGEEGVRLFALVAMGCVDVVVDAMRPADEDASGAAMGLLAEAILRLSRADDAGTVTT